MKKVLINLLILLYILFSTWLLIDIKINMLKKDKSYTVTSVRFEKPDYEETKKLVNGDEK
jgi:hypothetical protein